MVILPVETVSPPSWYAALRLLATAAVMSAEPWKKYIVYVASYT